MTLKIVIAEPRADKIDLWRDEFADVPSVEVVQAPPSELARKAHIDAELLPSLVAVMRYDAPACGGSIIVSTKDESESPPWAITAPQLPLHEGYEIGNDGRLVHVKTRTVSDEERVHMMFRAVFSAIDEFNLSGRGKIETLGFGAESVCYRCDLSAHVSTIKRAYVEYLQSSDPAT